MLDLAATVVLLARPTLAGVITNRLGWRWLFWMYVPLAVIAAILVWIGIHRAAQAERHTIDTLGMTVMTLAAIVMLLAFSFAGTRWAWGSVQVIGMLAVSIALWALFIRVESKAAEPALSPSILTNRIFMTSTGRGPDLHAGCRHDRCLSAAVPPGGAGDRHDGRRPDDDSLQRRPGRHGHLRRLSSWPGSRSTARS